jgi:hypothetical protein
MQDRHMHGMAGAAHLRLGDGLAVRRVDADGVLHRLLLRLLERSVELVRRADEEVAREGRREPGEARVGRLLLCRNTFVLRLVLVFLRVRFAEHHVVARRA